MKNTNKLLLIVLSLLQFIAIPGAHGIQINSKNELLIDSRGDDGDIYLCRLWLSKDIPDYSVKISAFGETQWNFKTSEWEKLTAGLEAGRSLSKYLHVSQSLQAINGQMLDYMCFNPGNDSIETTSKISLNMPLCKTLFKERLGLRLFEEYTFNLEENQAGLNELGAEITYRLAANASMAIGWHHSDRIHSFDSDYASSSLNLNF
ncbi:MAG: hypothetical protein WC569_00660 [Candidatus Omnitrophota bacterium]